MNLSSYSYLVAKAQNSISYYDKKNDLYRTIQSDDMDIYVKNDYYKIYVARDIIDYQGQNVVLTASLENLNTIDKKG